MLSVKDYYRILGVSPEASTAEIKRAYRRLAKELHPDRLKGSTGEKFRELKLAYDTLVDEEKRREYDVRLRGEAGVAVPVRFQTGGDFSSPFGDPAWVGGRMGASQGVEIEVELTREEALRGGRFALRIPLEVECWACGGGGGFLWPCLHCGGLGRLLRQLQATLSLPSGLRSGNVYQQILREPGLGSFLLRVLVRVT